MAIGSDDINITKMLVNQLGSDLIRFYYGQDLIGNEIDAPKTLLVLLPVC